VLIGEVEPAILEAETLIDITKAQIDRAKKNAAKDRKDHEKPVSRQEALAEISGFAALLGDLEEEKPPRPRLIADDITPEAAAELLAAQGGRLGVMSAEGGIFSILAGRYSGVPNLDLFLKGHAGDALRVDRKSSSPIIVDNPALTLGLTVQPEILRQIAQMPGFRGRGLLARVLYALPENTVGYRLVGVDPPSDEIANRYDTRLVNMTKAMYGNRYFKREKGTPVDEDGYELDEAGVRVRHISDRDPTTDVAYYDLSMDVEPLKLSPEAAQLLLDVEGELEPRLRPDGDLSHIVDWASKQIGACVRIAGLIHAAETLAVPTTPITGEMMRNAVKLGDYFLAHALAAFDLMGADPAVEGARIIIDWVKRNHLDEFTRREAHRGCRNFKAVTELDPCLELLEHHGYIRRHETTVDGGGHRSKTYLVNPHV
jgi:hypothetical protein